MLQGSFQDKWARVGNSVPPLMMKAIGEYIRLRVFATYLPKLRSKLVVSHMAT